MLKKVMFFAISCWLSNFTYAGSMGGFHEYSLDGLYFGIGTGLLNLYTDDNFIARKSNSLINENQTERTTNTSILFNGNVGYGRMYTDTIYLGAKVNVIYSPFSFIENESYTAPSGTGSTTFGNNIYTTQIRPFYNIDAVLGYEIIPHFIPFVEGGLTFANVNKKYLLKKTVNDYVNNTSTQYGYTVNANNYSTGYNVGLGLNYQAQRHWVVSGEILYIDLGENFGVSGAQIPGTAIFDSQSRRLNSSAVAIFATISYLI